MIICSLVTTFISTQELICTISGANFLWDNDCNISKLDRESTITSALLTIRFLFRFSQESIWTSMHSRKYIPSLPYFYPAICLTYCIYVYAPVFVEMVPINEVLSVQCLVIKPWNTMDSKSQTLSNTTQHQYISAPCRRQHSWIYRLEEKDWWDVLCHSQFGS